ncbi:MAG: alpha/beta hydrolase [Planctomycetota bacterium]
MPLDPQVKVFLDKINALHTPPLSELTLEQVRAGVTTDPAELGQPEPMAATEDRHVPGPAGDVPVRIYTPHDSKPLPVFVYYHGGGFVLGDVPTHDAYCTAIAKAAGCIVVSVEYRLAPEHKYPAAVEDAFAAAGWVFGHAAAFGGDPGRIAVGGDSAGGNLAAVVCLMARDRQVAQPVLQILVYPMTDCSFDTPSHREYAEGYLLSREEMDWFLDCYLERPADGQEPYASPLLAESLAGVAPALVITAEYDPLRDEGEAYAARLRESGVPVTLTRYDGMIHAFARKLALFDRAKIALQQVALALKQAFA